MGKEKTMRYIQRHTHRHTDTHRPRHTDTQTHTHRDTDTDTHTHTHTHRLPLRAHVDRGAWRKGTQPAQFKGGEKEVGVHVKDV